MSAATGVAAPAGLPPRLPGLDPNWSRLVTTADARGVGRTWHVLDTAPQGAPLTVLCVHGNPTWSYLWRSVLAQVGREHGPDVRVVAVDHLDMGYSQRTGITQRLADRVAQLHCLADALQITGDVITVGHDWGGVISLAWAVDHLPQVRGIVLTNTALGQPDDARVPAALQVMRTPWTIHAATYRTSFFLDATLRLAHPALTPRVRHAYRLPYRSAPRRGGIFGFVDDIPLLPDHPTYRALHELQARLPELQHTPAVLLWGARDPVFSDRYLRDTQQRIPQARLHRFPTAGHLVVEDAPVALAISRFVATLRQPHLSVTMPLRHVVEPASGATPRSAADLGDELRRKRLDESPALVQLDAHGRTGSVSWRTLAERVDAIAGGLAQLGVRPGERVGMLVPPGADLTACVYACWRIGAVVVIADAGLGLSGLRRALSGARLRYVIAGPRGALAARAMGLGPSIVLVPDPTDPARHVGPLLPRATTLADLERGGAGASLPDPPPPDDDAAVLFTSGATGPAKGVVYRHRQLLAQRSAIRTMLGVSYDDRLVAAFAPFALYGPALGITSVVPDMRVTAPGTLTAQALFDAVRAIDATLVFASPAALRNVVTTVDRSQPPATVRALLSAGAPVPLDVLTAAAQLLGAEAHTPYGMTEALPITDIIAHELTTAVGRGVCVGRPLAGVEIGVCQLLPDGGSASHFTDTPEVTGEIVVRAEHVKDRYDQLWLTEDLTAHPLGWHRTGDVGHVDESGRLWVEGRLAHVITTSNGPVTSVPGEQDLESDPDITQAALVGVGPVGCQQVVAVVASPSLRRWREATIGELDAMRARLRYPLAAAFFVPRLPVDVRHNSKIDRSALARWASRVLCGETAKLP